MEYLYDEVPSRMRQQMDAHRAECPECQLQLQKWQSTLNSLDLDGGRLTRATPRHWSWIRRPALPWAAAVALALGLGFAIGTRGRLNQNEVSAQWAETRAEWLRQAERERQDHLQRTAQEISGAVRQENQQLLTEFARQIAEARSADRLLWARQLSTYDQERAMDYAELRNELTLLARQTGTGFRQAESQFNWLAGGLPAAGSQPVSGTNFLTQPLH